MTPDVQNAPSSTTRRWAGRIASGLPLLFLLFDGAVKLLRLGLVEASFARLGYPAEIAPAIGAIELVCLALYAVPRTSAAGAVLLTGFLGGATATHVRVGDPLLTHVLFPAFVGLLLWGGLVLRDDGVRALLERVWRPRLPPRTFGTRLEHEARPGR